MPSKQIPKSNRSLSGEPGCTLSQHCSALGEEVAPCKSVKRKQVKSSSILKGEYGLQWASQVALVVKNLPANEET